MISVGVEKSLTEILNDIQSCNGEEGVKRLIGMQGFWWGMNRTNPKRGKVLKSIENRLNKING